MKSFCGIIIPLFILTICSFESTGQTTYYQDVYYGGVTAGGFSTGQGIGTGTLDLHIEPGSAVRRAFLFALSYNSPDDSILINGDYFRFNDQTIVATFEHTSQTNSPQHINCIDITDWLISNFTETFDIEIEFQSGLPFQGVFAPYFVIEYESPSLQLINTSIVINNQNLDGYLEYAILSMNQIDVSNPVALALYSDRITSFSGDQEIVYVEGTQIGVLNGPDNINNTWDAGGVKGHFYYQDNQLFGLDDDTPDAIMVGSDGLADISSYLINNVTGINVASQHVNFPNQSDLGTNSILSYVLSYSSSCDTFSVTVPNDTLICQGEQFQLNVTGGQNYDWQSITPGGLSQLSCTDCANPIFTADTTAIYTVRIWNNDSCSVVRPIKILVNDLEIDDTVISPTDCGTTTGSIAVDHSAMSIYDVNLVVNGTNIGNDSLVNWIPEGEYIIHLVDENGCVGPADTVYVNSVINTLAQFTLNPSSGNAPLEVDITNTSQNATNYNWYVNNSYQGSQMNQYTFEDGGEYTIELIAWQYDPSCTDTFSVLITVSGVVIPTAFTPDNDNVNDYWEILQLNDYFPDNTVSIYNRWGTLIYQKSNGTYIHEPWYGTYNGKNLPTGSYFYVIEPNDGKTEAFEGTISILK